MFPTHVWMNRDRPSMNSGSACVPHACGDEPFVAIHQQTPTLAPLAYLVVFDANAPVFGHPLPQAGGCHQGPWRRLARTPGAPPSGWQRAPSQPRPVRASSLASAPQRSEYLGLWPRPAAVHRARPNPCPGPWATVGWSTTALSSYVQNTPGAELRGAATWPGTR